MRLIARHSWSRLEYQAHAENDFGSAELDRLHPLSHSLRHTGVLYVVPTPFTAICFLLAGAGVSWIAKGSKVAAAGISIAILFTYAMQLAFTLSLDRLVQSKIEGGVRRVVGKELNALMRPTDTAVLEPLGYIGWEARNKTIYDFPGLASPKAFAAFKYNYTMWGMVKVLEPTIVVLRPHELDQFMIHMPSFANEYKLVRSIDAEPGLHLSRWGLAYGNEIDMHFRIFERNGDFARDQR